MRPLVATSINPKGRGEHQKACFDAWRARGYEILTYNPAHEADELLAQGFDPSTIVRLGLEKTGHGMHKIPSPRILAVLDDVVARGVQSVLLVNSDIYPAIRPSSSPFAALGPCAAVTRNEVASLAIAPGAASNPYRGGLDAFYFTAASLEKLLVQLRSEPVSERMAFGIPGWDYYLGGHVLSPRLGGRILDADFLLHVSHAATYGNITEFDHYLDALRALGHVTATEANGAARQFAALISRQCEENHVLARRIALCSIDHAMVGPVAPSTGPDFGVEIATFQADNEEVAPSHRFDAVALTAAAHTGARPFPVMRAAMRKRASTATRFLAELHALRAVLLLPASRARLRRPTGRYPSGNLHGKAIEGIVAIKQPEAFRIALLELFGDELVLHGILNVQVLKCIILCCTNDEERGLLSEICGLLRELVDEESN